MSTGGPNPNPTAAGGANPNALVMMSAAQLMQILQSLGAQANATILPTLPLFQEWVALIMWVHGLEMVHND
jgi:hypothetical protein